MPQHWRCCHFVLQANIAVRMFAIFEDSCRPWTVDRFALAQDVQSPFALTAPIVAIWFWRRPRIGAREFLDISWIVHIYRETVVISSKPGSGPHHLLPFIPLCLYAAIVVADLRGPDTSRLSAIILILLLLAYCPSYIEDIRYARHLFLQSQSEREKRFELETLSKLPECADWRTAFALHTKAARVESHSLTQKGDGLYTTKSPSCRA